MHKIPIWEKKSINNKTLRRSRKESCIELESMTHRVRFAIRRDGRRYQEALPMRLEASSRYWVWNRSLVTALKNDVLCGRGFAPGNRIPRAD
mmetsp:Transcript_2914/g.13643  ORF Transcript_2914/g.13643 Transcript_2914/m.13643 type:complete len:92 (-) Transcript_2914:3806-4081(-)